jgi:V/A-type H+-transporting ATPase subunit E
LKNRQQVEIRQETLNEKQRFLHHLFAESTKKMEAWDEKEFQTFAEQALEQLDLAGEIQLIAGEKSAAYFTEEWLGRVNQNLSFHLVKSDQIFPKQAGFLLDDQGVQYNFIFSHLIQDLQGTMGYELAQQLFD